MYYLIRVKETIKYVIVNKSQLKLKKKLQKIYKNIRKELSLRTLDIQTFYLHSYSRTVECCYE
jgi:hypothetical protein